MKNFLVKICLIIVSFLGLSASYASQLDTALICSTLLDSRFSEIKDFDESTQKFGHIKILEQAYSDTSINEGLNKIRFYLNSEEKAKTRLIRSAGFQKAIMVCAQAHGFEAYDVDQLIQSVIGLVDTTSLISSKESSFLALSYVFNKAIKHDMKSYNDFMNSVLRTAYDKLSSITIAEHYLELNSLQELLVNMFASESIETINDFDADYNQQESQDSLSNNSATSLIDGAVVNSHAGTTSSILPLEVIEQLDKILLQKANLQVALQTEAGKVLMGAALAHENFWKHWLNSSVATNETDKARVDFLKNLFELQNLYSVKFEDLTVDKQSRVSELLILLNSFDYSLRNITSQGYRSSSN